MTKILFILSAVVILVSSFFAYQNGRAFAQVRTEKLQKHAAIKTELSALSTETGKKTKVDEEVERVQGELDVELEKVKAQKLKIAQADPEPVQKQLDTKNAELAGLNEKLDKLPKDVKPETLVEDINRVKQRIAELGAEADRKKGEVESKLKKANDLQKVLDDIIRKIEERKKSFDRNGLVAQVVAVNNDWGFVVINAGKSRGITPDTKLLVTRGVETVGKLSILSVEGSRTVANIIEDSVVPGKAVAPGDKVILENLYQ
jgi:Skp family chaperone for outer membrane proteins